MTTKSDKTNQNNAIAAIVALCLIEIVALMNGYDGIVMSMIVTAIAGLGGYSVGRLFNNVKSKK